MSLSCEQQCINGKYYLCMPDNFQYPRNLLHRVYKNLVVLEDIFTRNVTAYGTIRVNNCSFDKRVFVRYTIDQWKTFSVLNAHYIMHYADNNTDLFQFKLTVPKDKLLSSSLLKMSFAICYCVNGGKFWDNNYSQNYNFEIIESSREVPTSILNQLSRKKSIIRDDQLYKQITQDYHAISNTTQQIENLCGLKNLGGTCYMNSILQSLSLTSLLTNYFLYNQDSLVFKGIIINEYLNFLYLIRCGQYSTIIPAPLKQIIGHINYAYLENQQQDAHEFLIVLLDYLHIDLNRTQCTDEEIDYNLFGQINKNSIIVDLFYGIYKSTITCLQCMHTSSSYESFVCLTLPIPSTNQCTLQDCLQSLNEDEYLIDDDSKWFCSKCQCHSNAKKRLEIHKLPKILIIQLKRFQMNSEMRWIKDESLVLYPEDDLDLHQYSSSPSSEQALYTLYSIVNHNGSLNDGHYTTFSRDLSYDQPQWFEYDDEIVKYLDLDQLHLNSKAYLLFYTMQHIPE
ncbi:unnamed protein product [Adineta steineri]|uniref:Ubiquitin carboxyl-terminal hydrolase n=2 Tax=Adineta steineri TaxID=433720 RepID=A0A818LXA1_9BILA|nr:unnamed protein product [Adineta steineri]CAF3583248.1 unnamed protein product [Adineta steineri]